MSDQEALGLAEVRQDVKNFNALMVEILAPSDVVIKKSKEGPKAFYKKTFFRKLAKHCKIKIDRVDETLAMVVKDDIVYFASYLATAPDGRTAPGDGCCSFAELLEENKKVSHHMARSVANTRAYNRAVSNLEAAGMVSAEEASIKTAIETAAKDGYSHDAGGNGADPTDDDSAKPTSDKQFGWLKGTVKNSKLKDSEFLDLVNKCAPGLPINEETTLPDLKKLNRGQWRNLMGALGVKV